MRLLSYRKKDESNPKIPSRYIRYKLIVWPFRVEIMQAWGRWSWSVKVCLWYFALHVLAYGGAGDWKCRFIACWEGIELYLSDGGGDGLSVGLHYDKIGRSMDKGIKELRKYPEKMKLLRKIFRQLYDRKDS